MTARTLRIEATGDFWGGKIKPKIRLTVENDVPGAKLELPDDVLKKAKGSREESKPKPVKAVKAKRTVADARKSKPANVAKPLDENEIAGAKEAQSSQAQSKSVKVGQTSLVPAADEGPAVAEAMAGKLGSGLGAGTEAGKTAPSEDSGAKSPIGPIGPIILGQEQG